MIILGWVDPLKIKCGQCYAEVFEECKPYGCGTHNARYVDAASRKHFELIQAVTVDFSELDSSKSVRGAGYHDVTLRE